MYRHTPYNHIAGVDSRGSIFPVVESSRTAAVHWSLYVCGLCCVCSSGSLVHRLECYCTRMVTGPCMFSSRVFFYFYVFMGGLSTKHALVRLDRSAHRLIFKLDRKARTIGVRLCATTYVHARGKKDCGSPRQKYMRKS